MFTACCAYAELEDKSTTAAVVSPTFQSVFRIDVAPFKYLPATAGSGFMSSCLCESTLEDSI